MIQFCDVVFCFFKQKAAYEMRMSYWSSDVCSSDLLRLAGSWLSLAFCAVMLVAGWINFHEAWVNGWTAPTVWAPPLWIPYAAVPIGFAMLCLQYTAEILRLHTDAQAVAIEPDAEISAFKNVDSHEGTSS